tara:strand:+ start:81 stop:527 length:447 start_codon:yes stop_codon:yes gene_type:complete
MAKKEQTLIIIKPDATHISDKIFLELDKLGEKIKEVEIIATPEDIYKHYKPSIEKHGKFLQKWLEDYLLEGKIILSIYEGFDIIKKIKNILGETDPSTSQPNTIRGKYGKDSLEKSLKEKRAVRTLVHASESKQEAKRELKVWKRYLD